MTDKEKMREFWIDKGILRDEKGNPVMALLQDTPDSINQNFHLIEYRAYEELQKEIASLKQTIAEMKDYEKILVEQKVMRDEALNKCGLLLKERDEEVERLKKEIKEAREIISKELSINFLTNAGYRLAKDWLSRNKEGE